MKIKTSSVLFVELSLILAEGANFFVITNGR